MEPNYLQMAREILAGLPPQKPPPAKVEALTDDAIARRVYANIEARLKEYSNHVESASRINSRTEV